MIEAIKAKPSMRDPDTRYQIQIPRYKYQIHETRYYKHTRYRLG